MSTETAPATNFIASARVAEMEHEAATTRKVLERIPVEKFDWKPHEKSMGFKQLASHAAEIFAWTIPSVQDAELDFAKWEYKPFDPATTEDLLDFFDKNVEGALEVLRNTPDSVFMETWSLRNGDEIYFTLPKAAVMRSFVMNHMIHHRGQLSVYLRLNDIPVPAIYGPSADEAM